MPELSKNDPAASTEQGLRKLFQVAGHASPGTDLTERIMARVAVTPIACPVPVTSLIGRRAWAGVAACAALFPMLLLALANGDASGAPTLTAPLLDLLNGIRFPRVNWSLWAAGGAVCVLLFSVLDRLLARRTLPIRN